MDLPGISCLALFPSLGNLEGIGIFTKTLWLGCDQLWKCIAYLNSSNHFPSLEIAWSHSITGSEGTHSEVGFPLYGGNHSEKREWIPYTEKCKEGRWRQRKRGREGRREIGRERWRGEGEEIIGAGRVLTPSSWSTTYSSFRYSQSGTATLLLRD